MAVFLEGVDLGDLVIKDEFSRIPIEEKFSHTLGGKELVWEQNISYVPLTLVGTADTGWLTRETLNELQNMASVPNSLYYLNYEGKQFMVHFDNSKKSIVANPLIPRPNQQGDDYYNNIELNFVEVL